MPVIGLNIDKIDAQKITKLSGKVEIKNSLAITNVEQESLTLSKSEEVLKFSFSYGIKYEPEVGQIGLDGSVLYMEEPEKVKEILADWKKDKKLSQSLTTSILNTILAKCNIKALNLSQELNLPPHIRLPHFKADKTKQETH